MSQPVFRKSALAAALVSLGLALGASAQGTSQQPSGGTTATPAPPAAGSTGMDKGAGSAASKSTSSSANSTAKGSAPSSLAGGERRFLETVARHGMAEVEMGRLAQQNGGSQQVKDFGKRMVDDHSKANDEVKRIATAKGVTLPTDMDSSHKRKLDKMSKKTGNDFDRAYMDDMVDDHQKDVKEFRSMAKNAKDADVRSFASTTLPTLEQHLSMAKSTEDAVKQARRGGNTTTAGSSGGTMSSGASGSASSATGAPSSSGMASGTHPAPTTAGSSSNTKNTSPSK